MMGARSVLGTAGIVTATLEGMTQLSPVSLSVRVGTSVLHFPCVIPPSCPIIPEMVYI